MPKKYKNFDAVDCLLKSHNGESTTKSSGHIQYHLKEYDLYVNIYTTKNTWTFQGNGDSSEFAKNLSQLIEVL